MTYCTAKLCVELTVNDRRSSSSNEIDVALLLMLMVGDESTDVDSQCDANTGIPQQLL